MSDHRRNIRNALLGVGLSLALHGLFALGVSSFFTIPELGIEFEEPTEIEFGIVESESPSEPPAAPEATPPEPIAESPSTEGEPAIVDAGPRRRDAGPRDAGVEEDANRPAIARATEGRDPRLPEGANVALRFDFAKLRETPLAADVSRLLASVVDFRAVISLSGLDPVQDLDQFVMTSRNPWRRTTYMYVGRMRYDESWARERVAALAAAKNLPAEWTEVDGIPVAPWHDDDTDVNRVLALLGDRYFLLAPAESVSTLRAWIATLGNSGEGASSALGLADGELLGFAAENVPRYLREDQRAAAPTTARLSIAVEGGDYDVALRADFEDEAVATSTAALANDRLEAIGSSGAVRMFGLSDLISGIELEASGRRLRGRSELRPSDVQLLLAAAQSSIESFYESRRDPAATP